MPMQHIHHSLSLTRSYSFVTRRCDGAVFHPQPTHTVVVHLSVYCSTTCVCILYSNMNVHQGVVFECIAEDDEMQTVHLIFAHTIHYSAPPLSALINQYPYDQPIWLN